MRPARIVAVTRLMLDMIDDLASGPDSAMCQSERRFLERLHFQKDDLRAIHDHAICDMNAMVHSIHAL